MRKVVVRSDWRAFFCAVTGTVLAVCGAPESLADSLTGTAVVKEFSCDGLGPVSFRFLGPEVIALTLGDDPERTLTRQRSASGVRYAGEGVEFWNKGEQAVLTADGVTHNCNAVAAHGSNAEAPLPRDIPQQTLLDRYATPESSFAYLNRTLLHYRDEGAGPAVVLIHGSLQDIYDWDPWVDELVKDYRVVRFDMPAAGLTGPVGSGDYSIGNTMRTLDALMERLGEEQFAVVGTSLGGIVAFRYAATRPERVAALILMNSAGVEWGNEKIIPPQPRRYNESLSDTISRASLEVILSAVIPDPEKIPPGRLERGLDYQRREGRHLESAAVVNAYDRGEPGDVLKKIVAPTLLLWGAENRALDPAVADEFARLMPCAVHLEKVLVAGSGHWPHIEAPMRSVRAAEQFLDEHYAPGSRIEPGRCKPSEAMAGVSGKD